MINGIININKDKDMTSHDVVNIVRRKLSIKKVGHTGTLDPMATGVLPICIGKATKLASIITDGNKCYSVSMRLGFATDTYDISGEITDTSDVEVSDKEIIEATKSFLGEIMQTPPMYSAIKVDGKKLYELARQGKVVERKQRKINIFSIEDIKVDGKDVSFVVYCSKGTYVRSLVYDIGQKLGTFATMTELCRLSSGDYDLDTAISVDDFKNSSIEDIECRVQSLEEYFADLEKIIVPEKLNKYLYNGNKIGYKNLISDSQYNLYSKYDEYMGVYVYKDGFLHPKYFWGFREE